MLAVIASDCSVVIPILAVFNSIAVVFVSIAAVLLVIFVEFV